MIISTIASLSNRPEPPRPPGRNSDTGRSRGTRSHDKAHQGISRVPHESSRWRDPDRARALQGHALRAGHTRRGRDLLFISGATPSPLYHKHPHVLSGPRTSNQIKDQVRRAMNTVQAILQHEGLGWTDVVKMTQVPDADMRDHGRHERGAAEYLKNWRPAEHDDLRQPALHPGRPGRDRRHPRCTRSLRRRSATSFWYPCRLTRPRHAQSVRASHSRSMMCP